jgi:superfamily II DNA or RNA helicase
MGLYRQMIGRVLRPAEGKADAIILDHSGAVYRHGLPEDHVEWTLDVDRRAENPTHEQRKSGDEPKLRECPQCQQIIVVPPCANCGWEPQRRGRDVDVAEGELGLVVGGRARGVEYDPATKQEWHSMLRHIAEHRGYKPGWAAHKYKEKFGSFPSWGSTPQPITPTPEVARWVRSRNIAWAKRRVAA